MTQSLLDTAEGRRLIEADAAGWRRWWGPYPSDRQWGTGSQRRGELRSIGALAALYLLELRHHFAACLGDIGGDGLALCLKAKPGSAP